MQLRSYSIQCGQYLALYGTNGFTNEHEAAIKGLNDLEEIILFFDGDEAGTCSKREIPQAVEAVKARHQNQLCQYTKWRRCE